MNYILFDDQSWSNLLPLTFTRPVGEIRVGALTMKEKWEYFLCASTSYLTQAYLQDKFPLNKTSDNILINASIIPTKELVSEIVRLQIGQMLVSEKNIIACKSEKAFFPEAIINPVESKEKITKINFPWDIFTLNGKAIVDDFAILTKNKKTQEISSTNSCLAKENIFAEEGSKLEFVTLNASGGPIYIGKNAEIMENSVIRGPFVLGEGAVIKMGAKIYGPTTIGPYSKVGGECNNVVIFSNSNKAHDGFLGNAVLGEWCNLGADTNNSNLKNNYAEVKVWNYPAHKFIPTGLQFCGLIMGDHSKCGINTMFNTGTVVGVCANIFGAGFPRNYIPSFSWGGPLGMTEYKLDTAFEVAERVFQRRGKEFTETDKKIFQYIFDETRNHS